MTITERALSLLHPSGEIAWSGMQNGTQKDLSDGIATQFGRERQIGKDIVNDFFPSDTTLLTEWEEVFKLPSGELLTNQQRRGRLKAVWSRISPGTFTGMNMIYALSGLDVIARPLAVGEDPRVIAAADQETIIYDTAYGKSVYGLDTRFGEKTIIPGTGEEKVYISLFGSSVFGTNTKYGGFKLTESTAKPKILADGRPGTPQKNYISVFGSSKYGGFTASGRYGNFQGFKIEDPELTIPDDEWIWGMIYVIESPEGEFAQIPLKMKDAYEFLTYKNKPHFMWAISRVEYV